MNVNYIKEEIRAQVNISDLVERLTGARLNKRKMLCPFHSEKTPSFFVNDEKGLFYCQGCGTGGDIFKFVQLYKNLRFNDAVAFIDIEFHLGLTNTKPKFGQFIATNSRQQERNKELRLEAKKKAEYDYIAEEYKICTFAIRYTEVFSDLWAYYMNKRIYLDYLIEEGGY